MKKILLLLVFAVTAAFIALAYFKIYQAETPVNKYFSYRDIPYVFIKNDFLEVGMDQQVYLGTIHQKTRGGWINFSREQLEEALNNDEKVQLQEQIGQLVKIDYNRDAQIDFEEALRHVSTKKNYRRNLTNSEKQEVLKRQATSLIKKYDTDKDSIISYKEMNTLAKGAARNMSRKKPKEAEHLDLQEYLWLDPSQDGVFTLQDMEILSQKVFNTVDLDMDDKISVEEYEAFKSIVGGSRPIQNQYVSSACRFEEVSFPKNMKVYAVSFIGENYPPQYSNKEFEISVNEKGPIALIIAKNNGDGIKWNIKASDNTNIKAVLFNQNREYLAGLDQNVPIFMPGHETGCTLGRSFEINPLSRQFFEKSVDLSFEHSKENVFYIPYESGPEEAKETEEDRRNRDTAELEDLSYPYKVDAHNTTLSLHLMNERVRFAEVQDLDAWDMAFAKSKEEVPEDIPPIAGRNMYETIPRMIENTLGEIYVATKDLKECPMPGMHSNGEGFLIVKKGIPFPKFNQNCRYFTMFDVNNATCFSPDYNYQQLWGCSSWEEKEREFFATESEGRLE